MIVELSVANMKAFHLVGIAAVLGLACYSQTAPRNFPRRTPSNNAPMTVVKTRDTVKMSDGTGVRELNVNDDIPAGAKLVTSPGASLVFAAACGTLMELGSD